MGARPGPGHGRRLSFFETVLVWETHGKDDYDRTACEQSELKREDIEEVLEMRHDLPSPPTTPSILPSPEPSDREPSNISSDWAAVASALGMISGPIADPLERPSVPFQASVAAGLEARLSAGIPDQQSAWDSRQFTGDLDPKVDPRALGAFTKRRFSHPHFRKDRRPAILGALPLTVRSLLVVGMCQLHRGNLRVLHLRLKWAKLIKA
ncbi:hypothetical protein HDU93_008467 [Gonapodya sp. JEL0774]|nr:hypothetical protein HDU93_008467 [Gonapodya sp. JEL0774]